jgi:hypothetical protein
MCKGAICNPRKIILTYLKTHNRTTQKTKNRRNTDPTKKLNSNLMASKESNREILSVENNLRNKNK